MTLSWCARLICLLLEAYFRLMCTARMLQVCLLNYKKGGFPFWNQFFLAPIHDNSGVVEYYLGIQSDVTEQVEMRPPRADAPGR